MSGIRNCLLSGGTGRGAARTGAALLVLAVALVLLVRPANVARAEQPPTPNLVERVAQLEAQVAALQAALDAVEETLAPFSTVDDGAGGYDVYLESANLHIRNGLGATNGYPANPFTLDPANTEVNGLGNLFVGYNEVWPSAPPDRTGSHNIVLGIGHDYVAFAGLVAGLLNSVTAPCGSVSGGFMNTASHQCSSVSGGAQNTASGAYGSVSGGRWNTASGFMSSVTGGGENSATHDYSSVSGGWMNTANGNMGSVSGGAQNIAGGIGSVSGGLRNTASGYISSVSGGLEREASGEHDWAAGTLWEDE